VLPAVAGAQEIKVLTATITPIGSGLIETGASIRRLGVGKLAIVVPRSIATLVVIERLRIAEFFRVPKFLCL
jgi:hypothetical protein